MKNIKELLKEWKDDKIETGLYSTIDENGDNIIVEITNDYLKVTTIQKNNWSRINYYYKDGTVEELYE